MPSKVFHDPNSLSNTSLFQVNHMRLDWVIDFDEKIIKGSCTLRFELVATPATVNDYIILDSSDLDVTSVVEESTNGKLEFSIEKGNQFGQALRISLRNIKDISQLKKLNLKIEYSTSPKGASALQWMSPSQTLGQKQPYLFSQCQAIHARSIVPCQDTPSVKFTYEAFVTVKRPLQTLMSAIRRKETIIDENLVRYEYEQPIKIPSYLIAIVVGDLVSKDLGPRSRVWTEKEMIDRAAYEFAEVEDMLKHAESLMGEYVWTRYDLLVLPPTFPYGGMENPCLTFVTPTIIAGDRSLVSVIQHEITHSWTGNLVTNCSWEHFWLNEGFTKFIERKLIGFQYGSEKQRQFDCIEGWRELTEAVRVFGPESQLTKLVPDFTDVSPDDAFSSIPYEKGHMLLYHLEQILGGIDVFNKYLKAHIEKFKGLSVDTDMWKAYLYEYFSDKKDILDKVDWQGWLHTPGMPPCTFEFDQTISNQVRELAEKLYNQDVITSVDPVFESFNSNQKRELLSQLLDKESLSKQKIESLNEHYKFGSSQNSEILFRWLRLGIKAKWSPIIEPALKFVRDQGRMKYTRPVYRDLYGWEESREAAIDNFKAFSPYMHSTTASLVAKDLKL